MGQVHLLQLQLQLAAWIMSGSDSSINDFCMGLQMSPVCPGPVAWGSNTKQPRMPGVAGVIHDRLIYFKLL